MNKIHFAALLSGCLLFTGIASADPLVLFPTGNAAWTVDITYPRSTDAAATPTPMPARANAGATPPAADRKPKRIEIAQFNSEKKIRITWTDGQTTDQWSIPNLPVVFKEYPNGIVFPVGNGSMERKYDDFNMPATPSAFSWVTPACLKEKDPVSYQGEMCFHYVGTVSTPTTPLGHSIQQSASIALKREAWIDSKTSLPVRLDTDSSICIFTFQQPPARPLDMPVKFQQGIANYKHVMGFE
jgi:hypothetical protein